MKNIGKFSIFAPLEHFFNLHSNFSAVSIWAKIYENNKMDASETDNINNCVGLNMSTQFLSFVALQPEIKT